MLMFLILRVERSCRVLASEWNGTMRRRLNDHFSCDRKIDSNDEVDMMMAVVVVLLTSLLLSIMEMAGGRLVAEWFRRAWHAKPWCAASDL